MCYDFFQVICNSQMTILNAFAGWPGASNDARVFSKSKIGNLIMQNPESIIPANAVILGDKAYPLSHYLVTPFRDNGHLTVRQKNFNYFISSIRVSIECCFAGIKGRFRRLK